MVDECESYSDPYSADDFDDIINTMNDLLDAGWKIIEAFEAKPEENLSTFYVNPQGKRFESLEEATKDHENPHLDKIIISFEDLEEEALDEYVKRNQQKFYSSRKKSKNLLKKTLRNNHKRSVSLNNNKKLHKYIAQKEREIKSISKGL